MWISCIVVGLLASCASAFRTASDVALAFSKFKLDNGRVYATHDEEVARFAVFADNVAKAQALSAVGDAEFGVTRFSDLRAEEFKEMYLTYTPSADRALNVVVTPDSDQGFPDHCDYRGTNNITKVKNQNACGSCWAFSVTEAYESQCARAGGDNAKAPVLSTEQIVDCDTIDLGCDGGDPVSAYKYLKKAGGMTTAKIYPDTSSASGNAGRCRKFPKPANKITGFNYTTKPCNDDEHCNDQNEHKLALNVATTGPPSVCVNAEIWSGYVGGILTSKQCGGNGMSDLDHCVQVVGYNLKTHGTDGKHKKGYWIVRNSWGTDWGQDGFLYVEYGDNACGIANEATIPIVSD